MQQRSELPEGWVLTKLADLISPSKERIEPSNAPDMIYIGLEHIESNTGRITDHGYAKDTKSTKTCFHKGDVLYGKLRPYLNKVCTPDFEGVCSTDILVFNKKPNLESLYLKHFLKTPEFVDYANNNMKGVQLPRISFETLSKYEIPLPPLAEQHRIVAAIEALFARLDATEARLARVPEIMKQFRQSVLAAACEGRLTEVYQKNLLVNNSMERIQKESEQLFNNSITKWDKQFEPIDKYQGNLPENWRWEKLGECTIKITDGEHFRPKTVTKGIFFLSAKDIKDDHIDFNDPLFIDEETAEKARKRCNPEINDILVVSRGAGVGRCCIVDTNKIFCLLGSVILIKTNEKIDPKYLLNTIKSKNINYFMKRLSANTAQQALYIRDIKNLIIPIPPLPEQHEIIRRVDALLAYADQIEARVTAAQEHTEQLRQSILEQAFSGRLVRKSN